MSEFPFSRVLINCHLRCHFKKSYHYCENF